MNTVRTPQHPYDEKIMPVEGHVQELRKRIIRAVLWWGIASGGAYYYIEDIVRWLTKPAGKVYFLTPTEVFFAYLKLSLWLGFLISLPVLVYEGWAFFAPAFEPNLRKIGRRLVPGGVALFYIGLAFGYILVLPTAMTFFLSFSTPQLAPLFSFGAYLSFLIMFLLPFGIVFELPLIFFFLSCLGIVSASTLRHKRKYFIVFSFIFAGIISPTTDIFTQTMIAIPMLILYEVSIWLLAWQNKKT